MEEIDFLIVWVDGNDPEWQKEKSQYCNNYDGDNSIIRFRDWNLLKYWFRGVEKYAPWVRKVHFVTWGHLPDWLDTSNEKLNIINHKDYIPREYLPTYNSHTIELNLHRIEGLSEQFVYFNDDMFLIKKTSIEDFFKEGLPVDSAVLSPIIVSDINDIGYVVANNMGIINKYFNKNDVIKKSISKWVNIKYGKNLLRSLFLMPWRHFPGFFNDHLPQPFLKQTFVSLWEKEYDVIDSTCRNKLRNYHTDVSQWLARYWQLCENRFMPSSIKRGKDLDVVKDDAADFIKRQRAKMICINDSDKIEDFERLRQNIENAFNEILGEKSSFEK